MVNEDGQPVDPPKYAIDSFESKKVHSKRVCLLRLVKRE